MGGVGAKVALTDQREFRLLNDLFEQMRSVTITVAYASVMGLP
jgi:hypothetical protein